VIYGADLRHLHLPQAATARGHKFPALHQISVTKHAPPRLAACSLLLRLAQDLARSLLARLGGDRIARYDAP
jgi:hypothetical protein